MWSLSTVIRWVLVWETLAFHETHAPIGCVSVVVELEILVTIVRRTPSVCSKIGVVVVMVRTVVSIGLWSVGFVGAASKDGVQNRITSYLSNIHDVAIFHSTSYVLKGNFIQICILLSADFITFPT